MPRSRGAAKLAHKLGVDATWVSRYNKYHSAWRSFVQEYYSISPAEARSHFQPTPYMRPWAPKGRTDFGVLPFVQCLAIELGRVRAAYCDANPAIVASMMDAEKPHPRRSSFAIALQEEGNLLVNELSEVVARHGFREPTVVVFDEVWLNPVAGAMVDVAVAEFTGMVSVNVNVSVAASGLALASRLPHRITRMVAGGSVAIAEGFPKVKVSGKDTCSVFALAQLFPRESVNAIERTSGISGPFAYDQLAEMCPSFLFSCKGDVLPAELPEGKYLIHIRRICSLQVGHCSSME